MEKLIPVPPLLWKDKSKEKVVETGVPRIERNSVEIECGVIWFLGLFIPSIYLYLSLSAPSVVLCPLFSVSIGALEVFFCCRDYCCRYAQASSEAHLC